MQDALLATKLNVPRPRAGFLARSRLVERLDRGAAVKLTLVSAPAGFGKTTALAEWVRSSHRPVGWLSLDTGDNDPVRFWRYVAAALDEVQPGMHPRIAALLRGQHQLPLEPVLTVVINELAARPEQIALVLDDYHLIEAPAVHQSVAYLLDRLPSSLQLVLSTRSDPPLPLARLRASGQLVELREAELRFTAQEAADLLREATGLDLPAESVAALATRTEGWIAGLQLAALSLSGHSDPAGFVETFTGSHRFVLDYLTEEVLARQPAELVQFMLETSVLDRLCGPLCDAVCGQKDSQQLLERIERANLFLVPLDDVRRWWRYHHLFADLLQARLQQASPDRVIELHRAAAAWCEEHGLGDDAIRHALAAGDPNWAAQLIERHLEEQILRRSEGATMARWLSALPAEVVRSRPRLCIGQAIIALISGRPDQAEPLIDAAERTATKIDTGPYQPSVGRRASILANLPAVLAVSHADLARLRGDSEEEVRFAEEALTKTTDEDYLLRSFARYHLGVAEWLGGRLALAEDTLHKVIEDRLASGERYLAVRACYDLGQVQQAQGRLAAALRTYQRALELTTEPGQLVLAGAGMAHVGLAEVLYERDELDVAYDHAVEGVARCRQLAYKPAVAAGLAILARIRSAQGDRAAAIEAIEEAQNVMPGLEVPGVLNSVPSARARLLLADGDLAAIADWVRRRGLDAGDQPDYPRERGYLIMARLLLAEQAPVRALDLLARLADLARAQERAGSLIEITALQALGLAATRDEAGAVAALAEAVRLAAPAGYLRVFLDEGAPMAALLGRLATTPTAAALTTTPLPRVHLDRLFHAFEHHGLAILPRTSPGGTVVPGLLAPMTARELQVLELLAAGEPNQMIAERLVITLDTVKRHVSHVLDKLGAANRTQAVARARELGLLE
jgi:LuxR family transcriptional regulator, maltose regulon positive regulatory protein